MSLSCGGLGSPSAWGGEGGVGGDHPLAEHGHRHHGNSLPASAVIGCQGQTEAFAPPRWEESVCLEAASGEETTAEP